MLDVNQHIGVNAVIYSIALIATSYLYKASDTSTFIGTTNKKVLLIFGIVIFSVSLFLTPILLNISAKQKCGRPKPGFDGESVGRAVLVAIMAYIFYLAYHFIKILREPFVSFFGDRWYAHGLGIAFYVTIIVITFVTVNFFDGMRSACNIPVSQCLENVQPYLESQRYMTEEEVAEDDEIGSSV